MYTSTASSSQYHTAVHSTGRFTGYPRVQQYQVPVSIRDKTAVFNSTGMTQQQYSYFSLTALFVSQKGRKSVILAYTTGSTGIKILVQVLGIRKVMQDTGTSMRYWCKIQAADTGTAVLYRRTCVVLVWFCCFSSRE